MNKNKIRLLPFDYDKYKAGAKAVFRHAPDKIILIKPGKNSNYPLLIVFEEEDGLCEWTAVREDGHLSDKDNNYDVMLQEEIEEKTFNEKDKLSPSFIVDRMNLENLVCSLDLAKRLKELGVKQESLFYRFSCRGFQYLFCKYYEQYSPHVNLDIKDGYSAFTAAELGEMLSDGFYTTKIQGGYWKCSCVELNAYTTHHSFGKSEADARAKLLIFLIEEDLIK